MTLQEAMESAQVSILTMQVEHSKHMNALAIREAQLKAEKAEWECRLAKLAYQAGCEQAEKLGLRMGRLS